MQAETAERTEGEQAALEILTRQMTASATFLIQWGEDVKNLYPELQVMYNALYLIHFTVAEAKLKFC